MIQWILTVLLLVSMSGMNCPYSTITCPAVSADATSLRDQARQGANRLLEAEEGAGDGTAMPRSNASNKTTILLKRGQSRNISVTIAAEMTFEIRVLYSNDGPGTQDTLDIAVDGQSRSVTLTDTRGGCSPGDGWNSISAAGPVAPNVALKAGQNTITITLSSADEFGAEIDALLLFATEN